MRRLTTTTAKPAWRTGPLVPPLSATTSLEIYDARASLTEDRLSIATLVGLVNRGPAKIYLLETDDDEFWLQELDAALPRTRPDVSRSSLLEHLLTVYREQVQGLIIYDPNLLDTRNVASMLAGLRDGLAVSPAQADTLRAAPYHLPVLSDLRTYRWQTRLQAYAWAYEQLSPECSRELVAGLDPNIPGSARSYLVAQRVFTYWLDARKTFSTRLPGRLSERGLFKRILAHFPPGSAHLGWFPNEPFGVWLTSNAAILTLASDHSTNLTVWSSLPLAQTSDPAKIEDQVQKEPSGEHIEKSVDDSSSEQVSEQAAQKQDTNQKQTTYVDSTKNEGLTAVNVARPSRIRGMIQAARGAVPQPPRVGGTTYLSFTISDGDNLQYCQHRLLHLWRDPARGQIPIGWTIASALQQVMPPLAAYYRRTASANDELIAGPSGAAYVLPISLPKQHRAAFLRLTSDYMKAMQLTLLEVLDRDGWFSMKFRNLPLQKQFCSELADAGLRGILSGAGSHAPGWHQRAGLPIYQNLGLAYKPARTLNLIRRSAARGNRFLNVYIFAWQMTPTDLQEIVQQLGDGFTVVTPGRLLELMQKET